jgi:hypothetical protein
MKDWHRMCKAYTTDDDSCCDGCPVVDFHEHGGGAIFEMKDSTDYRRYADAIAAWAAEHPEPVYPTWREYLQEQGVLDVDYFPAASSTTSASKSYVQMVKTLAPFYRPIPADIAEKLGIEPKEDI